MRAGLCPRSKARIDSSQTETDVRGRGRSLIDNPGVPCALPCTVMRHTRTLMVWMVAPGKKTRKRAPDVSRKSPFGAKMSARSTGTKIVLGVSWKFRVGSCWIHWMA